MRHGGGISDRDVSEQAQAGTAVSDIPVRMLALSLLLTAGACEQAAIQGQAMAEVNASSERDAVDDEWVECAPGGATDFTRVCSVDRTRTDGGLVLTMRHPDGGFRRLLVTKDGRGVAAADGAEPAEVTLVDQDEIEVTIGNDHYRLPALQSDMGQ